MANTQLTRIVAPNINEVEYEAKMQAVFDNINENFAKIASLPFIQGVQGDSYQLVEKPIWDNNAKLTKDGALLLGSIFKTSFSVGTSFSELKYGGKTNKYLKDLTISINGKDVNPIDFFKDSEGNITNNILYFYAVINDSGEEEEKQLGQYYYFVDARLKVLGDVYYGADKSILSSFTDYTGFYQYKPETEKYDKISILPSLYYDQYKDDICWKFNGNESGVSAIGVKGMDGKDSSFQIVHVTLTGKQTISNTTSGTVKGVFKFNKTNTEPIWNTNSTDILNLVEGNAIISITDISSNTVYLAYGEIKKEKVDEKDEIVAYWNRDTVIDKLAYGTINSYFYDMRNVDSIPVNTPRYIAIPAITGSSAASVSAHTISNTVKDPADLKFQYAPEVFTDPDSSQVKLPDDSADESGNIKRKAIFENYNVEIKKGDLDIPVGEIRIGTTDGLGTITNTGNIVKIGYTTNNTDSSSYAIQLNAGKTNYNDAKAALAVRYSGGVGMGIVDVKPKLNVSGDCYISKELTVTKKASLNSDVNVNGKIYFKNNGNPNDPNKINSVNTIELGTQEGTNRHLDLKTDGVYIYKTLFADGEDKGQAELYVDGNINTVSGGNIKSDGDINVNRDLTVKGTINSLITPQVIGGWSANLPSKTTIITSNMITVYGKLLNVDKDLYFKMPFAADGSSRIFTGIISINVTDRNGYRKGTDELHVHILNSIGEETSNWVRSYSASVANKIHDDYSVYYIPGWADPILLGSARNSHK